MLVKAVWPSGYQDTVLVHTCGWAMHAKRRQATLLVCKPLSREQVLPSRRHGRSGPSSSQIVQRNPAPNKPTAPCPVGSPPTNGLAGHARGCPCHAMRNAQSNHDDPDTSTVMLPLLPRPPPAVRRAPSGCARVRVRVRQLPGRQLPGPSYLYLPGRAQGREVCRCHMQVEEDRPDLQMDIDGHKCPTTSSHYPETTSQDMMAWRAWLHLVVRLKHLSSGLPNTHVTAC